MSDLSFYGTSPRSGSHTSAPAHLVATRPSESALRLALVVAAVLLVHATLLVLLMRQTYRAPIVLANSEPPASVRVTMVQAPPPPPVTDLPPPTPQVLTTEQAERSVAPQPPEPAPPPPVSVPPPPKPAPVKPRPKPKPRLTPAPAPPASARPVPAVHQQVPPPAPAPTGPVAHDVSGEKLMELPTAGPKDVQTLGCRIPEPSYPRAALRRRIEGTVMVQLVIDPRGQVQNVVVANSSGNAELDEAALATVAKGACDPYVENGRAIAVRTSQRVSFSVKR